jgi:hypothetical protein
MPVQLLPVGPATVLTQNATYALPAQLCLVTSSSACETSLDGTTWAAFTSGNMSGAVFIRSAGVGTIVTCK